jgi:hypothetical protein
MLKNLICLAAKGVIRDANSNNVSVFSILEQLTPEGFPAFMQELDVLSVWQRDAGDPKDQELRFVVRLNKTEKIAVKVELRFGEALINRNIANLRGIVVDEPGELSFSFSQGKKTLAQYAVVVKAPPATAVPKKKSSKSS